MLNNTIALPKPTADLVSPPDPELESNLAKYERENSATMTDPRIADSDDASEMSVSDLFRDDDDDLFEYVDDDPFEDGPLFKHSVVSNEKGAGTTVTQPKATPAAPAPNLDADKGKVSISKMLNVNIFRKLSLYDHLSDEIVRLAELCLMANNDSLSKATKEFKNITGLDTRQSLFIVREVKNNF